MKAITLLDMQMKHYTEQSMMVEIELAYKPVNWVCSLELKSLCIIPKYFEYQNISLSKYIYKIFAWIVKIIKLWVSKSRKIDFKSFLI